jgi:histidyl-tRNA synthetase
MQWGRWHIAILPILYILFECFMASTNPARGMRDFLPADVRKREYVIGIIKQVYESYGYEPLETPAVENLETLMGKYGDEGNQLIFKILKRGEKLEESLGALLRRETGDQSQDLDFSRLPSLVSRLSDLALRYDLTVPLARVVADRRNDIPKFFKRYQIQPVWRADRPAKGRFREFYQCDVDSIGSRSVVVEAEQIAAVSTILKELKFRSSSFRMLLNHRDLLRAMLDCSGITAKHHTDALVAMDKIDKIGREKVTLEMLSRGIGKAEAENLGHFISEVIEVQLKCPDDKPSIANDKALEILRRYVRNHSEGVTALENIEATLKLIAGTAAEEQVLIAPALARGLSYYTGAIMELYAVEGDFRGSLGGGGRYDGLIGMFGKEQIPACGFSLGLERILVVMDERKMFPPEIAESHPADVMVTIWNDGSVAESIKLADDLRAKGLRVLLYPEAEKLGKQFKYADSVKVPYVCVLGESEIAEKNVTLKNMLTGEQETLSRESIFDKIKNSD